jgi:Uma2 family endonuclease
MTQPEANPATKLTGADYMALTPPSHRGERYQLIEGELVTMAGPNDPHQVFTGRFYIQLTLQTDALDIGETRVAPYDVVIDEHNTFQPDVLFVSNERRHIFSDDNHGINGAPDVVVEVLSDSTRRHDLEVKLPVYARNGVSEMLAVDLNAESITKYLGDGQSMGLATVYGPDDILTSDAMPGVAIDLGPIFARIRSVALPDG